MADSVIFKLVRRWRVQAYLDFMWMTRDFKFFFLNVASDTILNLAGISAVFLLAERFDGIGDWTRDQILFMLGYAAIVRGVTDTFFSYNILHISRRIGRGQMDHVLIQPQPIWMALLTEGFLPFSGSWSLLAGIGITIWSLHNLAVSFTFVWMSGFALLLLSSCTIVIAFSFAWSSLAFWAPFAAEEISTRAVRFMFQLKSFPLDGLGPFLTLSMLTVLPVGFVAWYPCRYLMGIEEHIALWHTPLAAVILSLIAWYLFHKGMQYYAQTGSQRYFGWGHRS